MSGLNLVVDAIRKLAGMPKYYIYTKKVMARDGVDNTNKSISNSVHLCASGEH